MSTLFISDLHLSAERSQTIRLFLDFLAEEAQQAEALYILGDLFEAWLGDDLVLPEYLPVIAALKALNDSGVPVYVMHGNRDFLLGGEFERMSGCHLIDDPQVIDLYGIPTLLMHGDLLCTDDHAYQEMRRQLRDPHWIAQFLTMTPEQRVAFARELRERSRRETGEKSETIMDVNNDTVTVYLKEYRVLRLIHGHTHRPASHSHPLDGTTATRYVLPDWHEYGGMLRCDADGCKAVRIG
ncbi:MAG: UDP-2,3-diacylglucosamine diphosphatase [Gammaproteobacteria bacterium]|nr:UDP-2,3-diacylglucosamine diphosphatase [Gammaproteobacteria bacterium]